MNSTTIIKLLWSTFWPCRRQQTRNWVSTTCILNFLSLFTDRHAAPDKSDGGCNSGPIVNTRPFVKYKEGNPFFMLPVISELLFPQFKGLRSPGFLHIKHQQGMCLAVVSLMTQVEQCIGRISLNPSRFPSPLLPWFTLTKLLLQPKTCPLWKGAQILITFSFVISQIWKAVSQSWGTSGNNNSYI